MTAGRDRSERFYRALLRVYPARFRELYGTDALELFRDRLTDARDRGAGAVAWLWLRTLPNVLFHGLMERLVSLGSGGDRSPVFGTAVRRLVRAPGLSATIVLTLGLGIGANVALFSVLRGVLLEPLPFPESDRLVHLWESNPGVDDQLHGVSPWDFGDWERGAESFESMSAFYLTSGTYRTEEWLEELRSAQVTADFFRTMGVAPLHGRDFRREEVTRYGPVMLSHSVWTRLFGADPGVVGTTIQSSGDTYEIVGVMPPDFTFPDESVQTWVAWNMDEVYADNPDSRTWRFLQSVGRLRPDVTLPAAEAELAAIASGLAESYPAMNAGWTAEVTSLHEDVVGDVRGTLWLAFGSVLFILLIACANVANLLLARMPSRMQDIGVRVTLGASRGRIARELLAENLLLGAAAGFLGFGLGVALIDLLVVLDAGRIPRLGEVSADLGVFAFTAVVALVTSVVFGAAPLLQLTRGAEPGLARGGLRTTAGSAQRRVREAFVSSQVALALVLLAGAGLFATSLDRLLQVDPGLDPESVAAFRVSLDPQGGQPGFIEVYYRGLLERIEDVPGVVSAAGAQTLALNPIGNDFQRPYRPVGTGLQAADAPAVNMRIVTPGYVETLGMTLLEGDVIPSSTRADEPLVAMINQTLADRLWPEGGAVGSSFEIDFREGWMPYRVTGVVQDVRHYGLREDTAPEVFLSHAQIPYVAMNIVVKTEGDPGTYFDDLREAVLAHTPRQPPHDFVSLEGLVAESTAEERFLSVLLTLFAAIGLFLAATGVYGVIAYTVSHRRREIGVRMALGAAPGGVVQGVLRQAVLMAGVGAAVGALVVLALSGVVEGLLFDVSPGDPRTIAVVAVTLCAVAGMAAWLPARRAALIAPAEALRAE